MIEGRASILDIEVGGRGEVCTKIHCLKVSGSAAVQYYKNIDNRTPQNAREVPYA